MLAFVGMLGSNPRAAGVLVATAKVSDLLGKLDHHEACSKPDKISRWKRSACPRTIRSGNSFQPVLCKRLLWSKLARAKVHASPHGVTRAELLHWESPPLAETEVKDSKLFLASWSF